MKYLSLEEILFIYDQIMQASRGQQGLRDFGLLHSACERPKATFMDKDLYKSVYDKAAALSHSLVLNHAFTDGNKRIGLAGMLAFLRKNKVELKASKDQLIKLALDIENKKLNIKDISKWIREKSKKI